MPDSVRALVMRLTGAGHEAWCVGGAVRDFLLGIPSTDFDIATSAPPEVVQRLFKRTVPIGIRFGTVGVIDADNVMREVTTFRADVETDGRHAVVQFGVSLEEDLARRDFTINAIAWQPETERWCDPFDGRADLHERVLRAVGDPSLRFREDYLRILRAIRFTARFGLQMDAATREACLALADGLSGLSAERVFDEWKKGLAATDDLGLLCALWHELGAAPVWLPELRAPDEVAQLHLPSKGEGRELVVLTAALASSPSAVLQRLKAPTAAIARAEAIEAGPQTPVDATAIAVRRWLAAVGEAADDLRALSRMRSGSDPAWGLELDAVRARGEATSRAQLKVGGRELIAAGVPAGPRLGAVLDQLLAEVIDAPELNDAARLVERGLQLAAKGRVS